MQSGHLMHPTHRLMSHHYLLPLLTLLFLTTSIKFANGLSNPTNTPTHLSFGVNARLTAKPERRDELAALLLFNRDSTLLNEPKQAQQFVFGTDTEDPSVFHLHERFVSKDGWESHRIAPHLAEWRAFKDSDPFVEEQTSFEFYNLAEGSGDPPPLSDDITREKFYLNVQIRIKPDVRSEFLEVIRANCLGSNRDEALCLQYAWGEDAGVTNLFHFHEEYMGREGFEAHAAAPHFKVWERFAGNGDPFVEPPVVNFFTAS